MPGPYILSSLSKSVVSRVCGGRSSTGHLGFKPTSSFSVWPSSSSSSPPSSVSLPSFSAPSFSLLPFEGESFLLADLLGEGLYFESLGLSVGDLLPLAAFFLSFFFRSLSKDRIVGGNCRGSPARMSFLDLKIGTQQTYKHIICLVPRPAKKETDTYGFNGLRSLVDDYHIKILVPELTTSC